MTEYVEVKLPVGYGTFSGVDSVLVTDGGALIIRQDSEPLTGDKIFTAYAPGNWCKVVSTRVES